MQKKNIIDTQELLERKIPREDDVRGHYFRDTTAILHSYPFRRLKNKTQVFYAPKNDHICTRIEHAFHVATIAAAVCKGLGLDSELAWAIGLGHDLGHAPFGHAGERVLNELTAQRGGFKHELFSLRVADLLSGYGEGMNLTYAVRDGIVCHCGEKFERELKPRREKLRLEELDDRSAVPCTWEGVVVRFADKIAYLGRDIEDAVQLNLISEEDLPDDAAAVLGRTNREIINTLVSDIIEHSSDKDAVAFSDRAFSAVMMLKKFNYHRIYLSPVLTGYYNYFRRMLNLLITYLEDLFSQWAFRTSQYREEKNLLAGRFGDYVGKMKACYERTGDDARQIALDYVAGMTDTYALECISEIITPRHMHEQFNRFFLKE